MKSVEMKKHLHDCGEMEQIIMAYLNCPYCPSQAYLARNSEHSDIPPLEKIQMRKR